MNTRTPGGQTIGGVAIDWADYTMQPPSTEGYVGQTINGVPINVEVPVKPKPRYLDELNALDRPLTPGALAAVLKRHADGVDILKQVHRFYSLTGGADELQLEDSDWFLLLGKCWHLIDAEAGVDVLMKGPFYELSQRTWWARIAGLSPRERRLRAWWRERCLAAFAEGLRVSVEEAGRIVDQFADVQV